MTMQRLALKVRSTTRHTIATLAALALVTFTPGCGGSPTDPGHEVTPGQVQPEPEPQPEPPVDVDVVGDYQLAAVDGKTLPASSSLGSGITYHRGYLSLYSNGTWESLVGESLYGEVLPVTDAGTYQVQGNIITFSRSDCPDVLYQGELTDDVLLIQYKGYCNTQIYTWFAFVRG